MFIVRHKNTPLDGSAPALQYGGWHDVALYLISLDLFWFRLRRLFNFYQPVFQFICPYGYPSIRIYFCCAEHSVSKMAAMSSSLLMRTIAVAPSLVSVWRQSWFCPDDSLYTGEEWHLAGTKERKVECWFLHEDLCWRQMIVWQQGQCFRRFHRRDVNSNVYYDTRFSLVNHRSGH